MRLEAFDVTDPPLVVSATLVRRGLERSPRRLAFAGPAGVGKSTVCAVLSGTSPLLVDDPRWKPVPPIPIFNHADGIKEEVLDWVAHARHRALIPDEEATLDDFCNFLGLSPGIVKQDMWPVLGELWREISALLAEVYELRLELGPYANYPANAASGERVAFVDAHKALFRSTLQAYGQAMKAISANPIYWAEQTVSRGLSVPLCLNGDTRFKEEAEVLRGTGWTVVYLAADEATLAARRPEMSPAQRRHASERGIGPNDCDLTVDARQTLGKVVMDLAERLGRVPARSRS